MPFFQEYPWMERPGRVWLWLVLTVPSTLLAFGIFLLFVRKGERSISASTAYAERWNDVEMSSVESVEAERMG